MQAMYLFVNQIVIIEQSIKQKVLLANLITRLNFSFIPYGFAIRNGLCQLQCDNSDLRMVIKRFIFLNTWFCSANDLYVV